MGICPAGQDHQELGRALGGGVGRSQSRVRGGNLTPATVEKIYHVFRKVIGAAYEDDRIPRLPCPKNPPIARGKRKAVRFLTEGEVEALAAAIVPSFEVVIYVAAYGGFRIGELVALRLDDVDWLRGTIRVDENLTDVNGHLEFGAPKTGRAFRTVPIADPVVQKLARHVEKNQVRAPRDLLFRGRDRGVLRPNGWRRRHFDPAAARAGLCPLTPHDLRHTAASFLIAEGANQWMLAEILGHRDTRMIDRVYGHLFEKDRQALRDRMSQRAIRAAADNVIPLSR
ncbi:MAG: site-specific integrase [Actinomycetota bacterium]